MTYIMFDTIGMSDGYIGFLSFDDKKYVAFKNAVYPIDSGAHSFTLSDLADNVACRFDATVPDGHVLYIRFNGKAVNHGTMELSGEQEEQMKTMCRNTVSVLENLLSGFGS